MKWWLLSWLKHVGCMVLRYQLQMWIKCRQRFDCDSPVFFSAKMNEDPVIFALKKTRASQLKHRQDFIHVSSWYLRTVYPTFTVCVCVCMHMCVCVLTRLCLPGVGVQMIPTYSWACSSCLLHLLCSQKEDRCSGQCDEAQPALHRHCLPLLQDGSDKESHSRPEVSPC